MKTRSSCSSPPPARTEENLPPLELPTPSSIIIVYLCRFFQVVTTFFRDVAARLGQLLPIRSWRSRQEPLPLRVAQPDVDLPPPLRAGSCMLGPFYVRPPGVHLGEYPKLAYCQYHRDTGHDTDNCQELKKEVESLISKGHRSVETNAPPVIFPPSFLVDREIQVIHGGPSMANTHPERKVYSIGAGRKRARQVQKPITFSEEDLVGIEVPHDDPVVVDALVNSRRIFRLLVDTGSSCDVLYHSTIKRLGISLAGLTPYPYAIVGFSGDPAPVLGVMTLRVEFGTAPCSVTRMVHFLVVDLDSVYNGILGRPFLTSIDAAISVSHLKVKFPTHQGVGVVRGDQIQAKKCYAIACVLNGGRC